jgi:hypothetical protein
MVREPYEEETERIRFNEFSNNAVNFAYTLEPIENLNRITNNLAAPKYKNIIINKGKFYYRYHQKDSNSIGMLITNIDMNRIMLDKTEDPILLRMGPGRRTMALAQRALFYDINQNKEIYKIIESFEKGKVKIKPRPNKRLPTVEAALGMKSPNSPPTKTTAIQELGYKKISTDKELSRRSIEKSGLFNMVGKYPRKILGLGAMPPVTGWRDVMVMAAIGHMLSFIPRSSIFANDIDLRINLAKDVMSTINSVVPDPEKNKKIKRNVGAALGAENYRNELKIAKRFNKEAGIKLFRIYTIGSDRRVIETAKSLRSEFGDEIELFVGQIADNNQALRLIKNDIKADGLIFGHGGGQQCTSAINNMALTTLEDIYNITQDPRFNGTSLLVEGGLGRAIGVALILGIDCGLGNQKFVRGTIETGDLFLLDKYGKICQPYPGTASPVTQLIEADSEELRKRRLDAAGRTFYTEGKPGFMFFEAKANSMAFWLSEYSRHAARTLADLGVNNISELRELLKKNSDFLRILTNESLYLSKPHWK